MRGMTQSLWATANGDADEFLSSSGTIAIALGTGFAILSAIANGSFTIFSKTKAVKQSHVDPLVFNFWACIGIVLSSLVVLAWNDFVWSPLGLISGLFFVVSAANSYRAVRLIGVSVGTGVWSGTAVLISFVAGLLVDPQGGVKTLLWAFIAILVIVIGVGGVTYAGHVGREATGQEDSLETLLKSQDDSDGGRKFLGGVFAAVTAGILGGLIMIPVTRADKSVQGLNYLPSFGIGVAIFAPIVTFVPYLTIRECPNLAPLASALPGIVSGIVWNLGNMFSIVAIGYIGYSAAYPIMQTGLFFAGLWGLFLFEEIGGNGGIAFLISGVVIVVGVGLLTWASN